MTWRALPVTPDRFEEFADIFNPNRCESHCWCLSHRLRASDIEDLGGGSREQAMRSLCERGARPIVIGDKVWLGGGVIVCPGVTIGADTVVGAEEVVVKDLLGSVLAVGNPLGLSGRSLRDEAVVTHPVSNWSHFRARARSIHDVATKYDTATT